MTRQSAPRPAALTTCLLLLGTILSGLATPLHAETGWFAYGGGGTIQSNRPELDLLQLPIEVKTWESGWEAGGGLRIFATPEPGHDRPTWEIRLRTGAAGGSLDDVFFTYGHEGNGIDYTAANRETFSYSSWVLGASALANLHPKLGLFAGPVLQRVKFKGELDRDWDGDIPNFCFTCGDAQGTTDATEVYGLLEVGARVTPIARPVGIELFWVPRRITMLSDKQVGGNNYNPEFPDLENAWGARVTYDF